MNVLQFKCPKSNILIDTRVETTVAALSESWNKMLRLQCPHCGVEHLISGREAYIAYTLSSDRLYGSDLIAPHKR